MKNAPGCWGNGDGDGDEDEDGVGSCDWDKGMKVVAVVVVGGDAGFASVDTVEAEVTPVSSPDNRLEGGEEDDMAEWTG